MTEHEIITLCGSTRFWEEYQRVNARLTLAGAVVISVGVQARDSNGNVTLNTDELALLDSIHRKKIDMADIVFIINKNGYIGDRTSKEIEYAEARNKEIYWLHPGPLNKNSYADLINRIHTNTRKP